jgi:hypothetical protein
MGITEHEIVAFVLGAAIGSIVTYWNLTREKRAVANIRYKISNLGQSLNLSRAQYKSVITPEATAKFVSDDRILTVYRWVRETQSRHKLSPTALAATIILFEELLGLYAQDAIRAMTEVKYVADLAAYVQKIQAEKRSAT